MSSYASTSGLTYCRRAVGTAACLLLAGIIGCAGFKPPESQLFSGASRCQSALIAYRVERAVPQRKLPGPDFVNAILFGRGSQSVERQAMTLAVRYPHPAGRAGYARVECIVERQTPYGKPGAWLTAGLDAVRRVTDENMPGVSLGAGVQEAMGLDVPIGELEQTLAALRQNVATGAALLPGPAAAPSVQLFATVDGAMLPPRGQSVPELDQLVARVRREGNLISRSSSVAEPLAELAAQAAAMSTAATAIAGMPGAKPLTTAAPQASVAASAPPVSWPVAPASYLQPDGNVPALDDALVGAADAPIVRRLPPVGPSGR